MERPSHCRSISKRWLTPSEESFAGRVGAGITDLLMNALGFTWTSAAVPVWLVDSAWLYNGGSTGARTLLGAVASSTINVAGTVFSITIAALSVTAGQMGPRLLRNFTKDRGNQIALGAFLAIPLVFPEGFPSPRSDPGRT